MIEPGVDLGELPELVGRVEGLDDGEGDGVGDLAARTEIGVALVRLVQVRRYEREHAHVLRVRRAVRDPVCACVSMHEPRSIYDSPCERACRARREELWSPAEFPAPPGEISISRASRVAPLRGARWNFGRLLFLRIAVLLTPILQLFTRTKFVEWPSLPIGSLLLFVDG